MEKDLHSIAIVDPSSISCEGLKSILPGNRFKINHVWPSLDEAVNSMPLKDAPMVVLINLTADELPATEVLNELRRALPKARMVLISEKCDPVRVQKAMRANFDGFFLESFRTKAFPAAIELIMLGERVFPAVEVDAEVHEFDQQPSPFEDLSERQMRVVALLGKAYSNKEIARELDICESTVKVHVKAILRKTGSRNRTDAALLARGIGLHNSLEMPRSKPATGTRSNMARAAVATDRNGPKGGDVVSLGERAARF